MIVRVLFAVVVSLSMFAPLAAQTAPAAAGEIDGGTPKYIKDETPEERRERVGNEDPGLNPDPNKLFTRKGRQWKIERYDRRFAAYDKGAGLVRPMANVNFAFEIYQQNDKYVWVWMPTVEELKTAGEAPLDPQKASLFTEPQIAYLKRIAPEFEELSVPEARKVIRFEQSSKGLPSEGSWRNSGTFADMNGDGHLDIIAPPERGARSIMPAIFLGDGKGGWTPWAAAVWPRELQYGNVVAADFNSDKKMDLVFGQHLQAPIVLLGDGKGRFTIANNGMEEQFATRRAAVADVDADGDLDVIALWEGPAPGSRVSAGRLRAYINENRAQSWRRVDIAAAEELVAGDWLAVGKFNKDRYPDFATANIYFQRPETLFRSTGAAKWNVVDWQDGVLVPYLSIYGPVTTGRFGSRDLDDAIVTYHRTFPTDVNPDLVKQPSYSSVVGIDRISFAGKQPTRTPILRFAGDRPIGGVASADFDGDGKNDILYTRHSPREAVLLLGDGKGRFTRATVEGLDLAENPNYDVSVADVNRDGRPDVLVLFESTSDSPFGRQNGSVRFFLNRGGAKQ
ncbi:MAG TPA: VCBS repeat-containing protein [Thermoanaerobaculia bacterium]